MGKRTDRQTYDRKDRRIETLQRRDETCFLSTRILPARERLTRCGLTALNRIRPNEEQRRTSGRMQDIRPTGIIIATFRPYSAYVFLQ